MNPVLTTPSYLSRIHLNIVARTWRLYKTAIGLTNGFIGLHTVTVYTLYSSQLLTITPGWQQLLSLCSTALSSLGGVFTLQPTANNSAGILTAATRLEYSLVTNSATHLQSRGTWLRLLLRHSRNTSRDV
jgi:hypothetical protein